MIVGSDEISGCDTCTVVQPDCHDYYLFLLFNFSLKKTSVLVDIIYLIIPKMILGKW